MKAIEFRKLIQEEISKMLKEDKYIGKHIDNPIVTTAAKEAANQSTFSPNQHYIFEKGFLKGVEWLENLK
jgi:hypothetical protein